MKNFLQKIGVAAIGLSILFLLVDCGGETSSNKYLGKLPGIAKNYVDQIDVLKKDQKESSDMEESFKLDKEIKLLKEEGNKAIKDYLANNPITNLPFEQKADYKFTIKEVSVNPKYISSIYRLQLITKIKIDEDILNKYGGFKGRIFAYVTAVDKDGKSLTKKPGVFGSGFKTQQFKKGMDFELVGTIDNLANLETFEKFVFVSKEEYEKLK